MRTGILFFLALLALTLFAAQGSKNASYYVGDHKVVLIDKLTQLKVELPDACYSERMAEQNQWDESSVWFEDEDSLTAVSALLDERDVLRHRLKLTEVQLDRLPRDLRVLVVGEWWCPKRY